MPDTYVMGDLEVMRTLSSQFLRCACGQIWDCRSDEETCPGCGRRSASSTPATHAEWRAARKTLDM